MTSEAIKARIKQGYSETEELGVKTHKSQWLFLEALLVRTDLKHITKDVKAISSCVDKIKKEIGEHDLSDSIESVEKLDLALVSEIIDYYKSIFHVQLFLKKQLTAVDKLTEEVKGNFSPKEAEILTAFVEGIYEDLDRLGEIVNGIHEAIKTGSMDVLTKAKNLLGHKTGTLFDYMKMRRETKDIVKDTKYLNNFVKEQLHGRLTEDSLSKLEKHLTTEVKEIEDLWAREGFAVEDALGNVKKIQTFLDKSAQERVFPPAGAQSIDETHGEIFKLLIHLLSAIQKGILQEEHMAKDEEAKIKSKSR